MGIAKDKEPRASEHAQSRAAALRACRRPSADTGATHKDRVHQAKDAFLPVGHHCGPGDFEPAMDWAVEGLAVEVGDGQHVCVGFADGATVSWSFCCLWLRSWLAPGGGLLASRRLDGRNQIACRGICWRRCSAAALAEFLDGFFAQPDDDADDSNPGDQGDYANGGIVGEEGEEVGEQHAGRAGLRRRLVNG
jgi:hypothetical protein